MLKKIAILAILLTIFIGGNLLASERPWFYYDLTTHGYANTIKIGYIDVNNDKHEKVTLTNCASGTYTGGFYVGFGEEPPVVIYAEAWGPYSAYDYDDCTACANQTHYLELWIGCTPPGEEDPEQ